MFQNQCRSIIYSEKKHYLFVRSTGKDLYHTLVLRKTIIQPFGSGRDQFLQCRGWENHRASKNGAALWVQLYDELSADAEVTTPASDTPEEVRIGGLAGGQNRPICCDNSRLDE